MTIKIIGDTVVISLAPETRTMSADQYAKHMRDAAFDPAMKTGAAAGDKTELDALVTAAKAVKPG